MHKPPFAVPFALLLVLGTASADDKKPDPIDAKKLIGKWERKEGKAFAIEFKADGKVTSVVEGSEGVREGTYTVTGDRLTAALKYGDTEDRINSTIVSLTDTELVLKGANKVTTTLRRVKDKK